jgi:hypothetical protein
VGQAVLKAQRADSEPHTGKLDRQPGSGQHQVSEALTVHGGALTLPERPVTVAEEIRYKRVMTASQASA